MVRQKPSELQFFGYFHGFGGVQDGRGEIEFKETGGDRLQEGLKMKEGKFNKLSGEKEGEKARKIENKEEIREGKKKRNVERRIYKRTESWKEKRNFKRVVK